MCYLVAKDTEKRGCYALKTTHGEHLVKLKRTLNKEVGVKGIQLVTISRPTAYGEYAPYTFAKNEQEFKALVRDMRACPTQRNEWTEIMDIRVLGILSLWKKDSRKVLQIND